jgi:hypothetical protein
VEWATNLDLIQHELDRLCERRAAGWTKADARHYGYLCVLEAVLLGVPGRQGSSLHTGPPCAELRAGEQPPSSPGRALRP